jgi:hypothetical protein
MVKVEQIIAHLFNGGYSLFCVRDWHL